MANAEEEEKALIAKNKTALNTQITELLKAKKKTKWTEKTINKLATILAKMEYGDVETVRAMHDSDYLKKRVDEEGNGPESVLLRFLFEQNEAQPKKTYNQNIQDLLKTRLHLAPIAELNMTHAMPDPEAIDCLDQEKTKAANNNPPWAPMPLCEFFEKPWYPQGESHDKKLAEHRTYQRDRQKVQENRDMWLNGAQWAYIRLKHILTGEAVGLWDPYGGMCAQLENMLRMLEIGILKNDETMYLLDTFERRHLERSIKQGLKPEAIREYLIKGDDRHYSECLKMAIDRRNARKNAQKEKKDRGRDGQNDTRKRPYEKHENSRHSQENRPRSPRRGKHYYDPQCGFLTLPSGEEADHGVLFNPFIRVYTYPWISSVGGSLFKHRAGRAPSV